MDSISLAFLLLCFCGSIRADAQEKPPATQITAEKEASLGARLAGHYETTVKLLDDSLAVGYVRQLGEKLAASSEPRVSLQFKIVEDDDPDLTVFLGGRIYINSGLIAESAIEAELASALAYGIAHAASRHSARMLAALQSVQVGAVPMDALSWHWCRLRREQAANSPSYEDIVRLRQEYEPEADGQAIQYLWKCGYDPEAYPASLQKQMEKSAISPGLWGRIHSALEQVRSLPRRERYIVNTSEFDRVKERLLAIRKD